jgi:outer membrane receptor protein involved in Fe transport
LLPKISASFPIRENQVMFFNYNHSMVLPHPSMVYQGLNPLYQDRSVASKVGNPNLNPEVDISYELGLKTQLGTNDAFTVSTYWKDKYDFITTASIQIKDVNGRDVTRTMRVNSDYARARGLEVTYIKRIGKWFNGQISATYSAVRGQSSSASEALKAILNSGNRDDTKETPLAWDSPLDLKGVAIFTVNKKEGLFGVSWLNKMSFYFEAIYRTGRRYTPYILTGVDPLTKRPIYEQDPNPAARFSGLGESNFWIDFNFRRWFNVKKVRFEASVSVTNVLDNLNGIVPNPVTGRAYRYGDPLPSNQRDPMYIDPRDARSYGTPPEDPSRFRAPRQIMFGLNIKI